MLEVESPPAEATGLRKTLRDLFSRERPAETAADTSALVVFDTPTLEVGDPEKGVSLTVELYPCEDSNTVALDVTTLRLIGGVNSTSAVVELEKNTSSRSHRVTFRNAKLSKTVRHTLARHNRVADQISVSGVLKGDVEKAFLGKAKVEFVQS
jgi:hypothetical protein